MKKAAPTARVVGGTTTMDFMGPDEEALRVLYASAANAGTTNFVAPVAGAKSYSASQLMGGGRR